MVLLCLLGLFTGGFNLISTATALMHDIIIVGDQYYKKYPQKWKALQEKERFIQSQKQPLPAGLTLTFDTESASQMDGRFKLPVGDRNALWWVGFNLQEVAKPIF